MAWRNTPLMLRWRGSIETRWPEKYTPRREALQWPETNASDGRALWRQGDQKTTPLLERLYRNQVMGKSNPTSLMEMLHSAKVARIEKNYLKNGALYRLGDQKKNWWGSYIENRWPKNTPDRDLWKPSNLQDDSVWVDYCSVPTSWSIQRKSLFLPVAFDPVAQPANTATYRHSKENHPPVGENCTSITLTSGFQWRAEKFPSLTPGSASLAPCPWPSSTRFLLPHSVICRLSRYSWKWIPVKSSEYIMYLGSPKAHHHFLTEICLI